MVRLWGLILVIKIHICHLMKKPKSALPLLGIHVSHYSKNCIYNGKCHFGYCHYVRSQHALLLPFHQTWKHSNNIQGYIFQPHYHFHSWIPLLLLIWDCFEVSVNEDWWTVKYYKGEWASHIVCSSHFCYESCATVGMHFQRKQIPNTLQASHNYQHYKPLTIIS